jgi:hypothetical protein
VDVTDVAWGYVGRVGVALGRRKEGAAWARGRFSCGCGLASSDVDDHGGYDLRLGSVLGLSSLFLFSGVAIDLARGEVFAGFR